jgi:hypothetical protein
MKARVLVILLLAGTISFFTRAAQAQNWGTGQWGGMQACPYPNGIAKGASSQDDELNDLKKQAKELNDEKKDIKKDIRDADREKERLKTAITDVVNGQWATIILDHMDVGYNCCSNQPQQAPPVQQGPPAQQGPPDNQLPDQRLPDQRQPNVQQGDNSRPLPPPTAPPVQNQPKGEFLLNETPKNNRMPASFGDAMPGNRMPAAQVSAASDQGDGGYGPDLGQSQQGGYQGGGGGLLCHPNEIPYSRQDWKSQICRPDGHIGGLVCSRPPYIRGGAKGSEISACTRALDAYRKIVVNGEKLSNRLAKIDDDLALIKDQQKDIAREKKENHSDNDGASCPICDAMKRQTADTSLTDKLLPYLPTALGVGLGAIGEFMNYRGNQQQNQVDSRMGWPGQQYTFGSSMIPMATAGMQATTQIQQMQMLQSARNGAYGCSPGGGFVMGPNGQLIPVGGAFGYPNGMIPGMPNYGGGMFMPGYTPNMMGPYGVGGGGMPFPGLGAGMAYPGMGGLPGMAPGLGGFPAGMPGLGGFPAGMPGMGGFPAGMPGMGGFPAGYPNVLGSVPFGQSPFGGIPGAYGGLGMGGMGAGLGAYNPYTSFGGNRSAIDGSIANSYIGAGLSQSLGNLQMKMQQFNSIGTMGASPFGSSIYGSSAYPSYMSGATYGLSPSYGLGGLGVGLGVGIGGGYGLGTSYAPSYLGYTPNTYGYGR